MARVPGKPFDVATKRLLHRDPEAWLRALDLHIDGPLRIVDSDLSDVMAMPTRCSWKIRKLPN